MNVSLTQENLAKALQTVGRIVGNRSTLPVLANVLIKTESNRLKLSTTNLEMGITYWVGAKVDDEGSLTVPARLLGEYTSSLPSGNVNLHQEAMSLRIKAERYSSSINGIDAEEFPTIPTIDKEPALSIPASEFKQAMSQVVLVASSDDARPVLNGVYMYIDDGSLVMAATDSYRLAEKKLAVKTDQELKVIVPARTIQELLRMIGDTDANIDIILDEDQICFRFGDVELVSRLIDGQFPNYQQLIPKDIQTSFTIDTSEFGSIAKVASLFSKENAGSVTLSVDSANELMSLRSIASQVGENTSQAKVVVDGDDAEVSLNGRYISDALGVIKTQQVQFSITGKVNPCLLKPIDSEDYLHIIMPLRS